jgi:hypothetical protein
MRQSNAILSPSGISLPIRLGLISLLYFIAQMLAFRLPDSFGLIAAIWPAAGIALASLLICSRRHWPSLLGCLFVSGIAANLTTSRPIIASVGFMMANICETAASAWLITRFAPGIPIILASGYNEEQAMAGNHPELPHAFLSKPYEFDTLGDSVARVLSGKAKGIKHA